MTFTFNTIDYPGATATSAQGINDAGQIVGLFCDGFSCHSFLKDGASFTTIDVPGASFTRPWEINDVGQIVGTFFDAAGVEHGFVTSGTAPVPLAVAIDIKPGTFPNSINPQSRGRVPVALLSSPTFDATTADGSTVKFASASPENIGGPEDVNGDRLLDVVFHFATQSLNLPDGTTRACLTGKTTNGTEFEGCDSVQLVP